MWRSAWKSMRLWCSGKNCKRIGDNIRNISLPFVNFLTCKKRNNCIGGYVEGDEQAEELVGGAEVGEN